MEPMGRASCFCVFGSAVSGDWLGFRRTIVRLRLRIRFRIWIPGIRRTLNDLLKSVMQCGAPPKLNWPCALRAYVLESQQLQGFRRLQF